MEQPSIRKTYKEKLRPTPAQERALEEVLWRCRDLYNVALEQRITAWQRRRVSVSRYEQEAELKDIRAELSEYAAIHSHVLQDVLARLDKTYKVFFRRIQRGEKAGFPRFKGRNRFHSFTFKEYGNGARLDNGFLVLSRVGRINVHWSRPLEGIPKTVTISREADGWYVAIFCADVPAHPLSPTGQETGIDVGLKVFLITADGEAVENPRRHALTLVRQLHLLALCRVAVRLAQQRCPPPLPAGPGGRPRRYRDESLVLLGLVRTLWRLSYQDLRDWLVAWPALAFACGLPPDAQGRPCVPSASQQCRRGAQAGAPPCEMLLVVVVQLARRLHLISGRDLIIR